MVMLTILLNKTKRNSFLCERNTRVKEQRGVFRAAFKQDLITSLELTRKWCFNNCRETNGTRKLIKTCVLQKRRSIVLAWLLCLCLHCNTFGGQSGCTNVSPRSELLGWFVNLFRNISHHDLHLRMIAQEIPARKGRFRKFAGLVT